MSKRACIQLVVAGALCVALSLSLRHAPWWVKAFTWLIPVAAGYLIAGADMGRRGRGSGNGERTNGGIDA